MPIFLDGGPEIPENLLHAQEDGRLVFFCGAGISAAAGLPLFGSLVTQLYEKSGVTPNRIQAAAIKYKQYDVSIELLENNYIGGRIEIRNNLIEILEPDLSKEYALSMHKSLLTLSTDRQTCIKLVTTNYDHLFILAENALKEKLSHPIQYFKAPVLPIPKPSKWNSIIYLHGLLPDNKNDKELDELVLSSSDFGHAYLTERWASKFISELFKNFVVCFVGYSVNDPVMRYMVDAIAADRKLGDCNKNEIFAFVPHKNNDIDSVKEEWRSKKIEPILYDEKETDKLPPHARLYKTFEQWASIYRDGLSGKKSIIAEYARYTPLSNYEKNDPAVNNVLWALTDPGAADFFSKMTPPPPIEWLGPLSTFQFSAKDLKRFGYNCSKDIHDENIKFSFIDRPAHYSQNMMNLFMTSQLFYWDKIMTSLSEWLLRHLDKPELLLWLSSHNLCLNERFRTRLQAVLIEYNSKPNDNLKITKQMKVIWQLFLANRIGSANQNDYIIIYDVLESIRSFGITAASKSRLQYALTPYVVIKKPFIAQQQLNRDDQSDFINKFFKFEIELRSNHISAALEYSKGCPGHDKFDKFQYDLIDLYIFILKDILDLQNMLSLADDKYDLSYLKQPSIEKHDQNKGYTNWVIIIELLRDSWMSLAEKNPHKALQKVQEIWDIPYPVFKRIAIFCFKRIDIIPLNISLRLLLSSNAYWLWSSNTRREVLRLFISIGDKINYKEGTLIENAILDGPKTELLSHIEDDSKRNAIAKQMIWDRLNKLNQGGYKFSDKLNNYFDELSLELNIQSIYIDESDEFAIWMDTHPDHYPVQSTPIACSDLIQYIKENPETDYWEYQDDWEFRCENNTDVVICALAELANDGICPASRWTTLLYLSKMWKEKNDIQQYFTQISKAVGNLPDKKFKLICGALSNWVTNIIEKINLDNDDFLKLCYRILILSQTKYPSDNDILSYSINNPIGKITESLLIYLCRYDIQRQHELIGNYKVFLDLISATNYERYQAGRFILCRNIELFYRLDEAWSKQKLIPLFKWDKSEVEATVAWQGFLSSPRLYLPFITDVKDDLLITVNYYKNLGPVNSQYASIMTNIALNLDNIISKEELQEVFSNLSSDALQESIRIISLYINSSGNQIFDLWKSRIEPFFQIIWPNSNTQLATESLSHTIADLFVESRDLFPLLSSSIIAKWLIPFIHSIDIARKLSKSDLCKKFPKDSLTLLSKITKSILPGTANIIEDCLNQISNSDPSLINTSDFINLNHILEK